MLCCRMAVAEMLHLQRKRTTLGSLFCWSSIYKPWSGSRRKLQRSCRQTLLVRLPQIFQVSNSRVCSISMYQTFHLHGHNKKESKKYLVCLICRQPENSAYASVIVTGACCDGGDSRGAAQWFAQQRSSRHKEPRCFGQRYCY